MLRICSLFILLAFPASAETLSGPIRVIDADTFDIGAPVNIRLIGIDAAEEAQECTDGAGRRLACGQMATRAARDLWQGRQAQCEVQEYDRYGRALAVCFADGVNVNADLVRRGLAQVYRDDTTYAEEQKEAILMGRGLWTYAMQKPAEWRAAQRALQAADNAPQGTCEIKGNISDRGYIYHMPGTRAYGPTRINEARGERWFCTEAEARAAGWRPAN